MRNLVREKLFYLSNSPNIVSVNVSRRGMRDRERACESMVDSEEKGSFWRLSTAGEIEIRVELKETEHK